MKGVVAVLTGADYVADGMKGALQRPNPAGAIDIKIPAFAPEKRPVLDERHHPLVRWIACAIQAKCVAMVIADSILAAKRRRRSGRGRIRGAAGGNRRAQSASAPSRSGRHPPPTMSRSIRSSATPRRCERRSHAADLVVEQTFRNQRIVNCPDGAALRRRLLRRGDRLLHADFRQPGRPRAAHACWRKASACRNEKIHFVCPDVGGGFGLRNNLYPEQAAILWAAKRVGRPVKWTNDRSESFLTDYAGRDLVTTARIALTRRGAHHRLSGRPHRHHRRADRDVRAAEQRLSRRHHRVRHPADAHALPLGGHQHGADRAVPRRRAARGDAGAGAADRPRRGAARHGSRQNPAART